MADKEPQELYDEDIIKRNRRNTYIFVIAIVVVVLAAIISALLINKYVITSYEIDGSSMYPTLIGASYDEEGNKVIGDYVYLNKSKKKYDRGDIIVFVAHVDEATGAETKYVKRIIGIPGDTVEIKDNVLYLNGERQDESYINEPMITPDIKVTVQDGCYFVMGDNRNHSSDSRTEWADNNHCVPTSRIIGKAFLIKHASGKLQWIKK